MKRLIGINDGAKRAQVLNCSHKLMALASAAFIPAKRFSRLIPGALLSLVWFSIQPLNAETSLDSNPLPKILQDWEKRGREISAVRYVLSGTTTWPRGSALPPGVASSEVPVGYRSDNPVEDVVGDFSAVVTLDFKRSRCRIESVISGYAVETRQLYRIRTIGVGAEGKTVVHILENTDPSLKQAELEDFLILTGNREVIPASRMGDGRFYPLAHASGVIPLAQHRLKTSNLKPGLTPEAFIFEGCQTNHGRAFASLRVDYVGRYHQTNRYWVDLERDSAITKEISHLGVSTNGPFTICEISYGLEDNVWLPKRWTKTDYLMNQRLQTIDRISVSEHKFLSQVSDELFELQPSPGMKIYEKDHQIDPVTQKLVVQRRKYCLNAAGAVEHESLTTETFDIGRTVPRH